MSIGYKKMGKYMSDQSTSQSDTLSEDVTIGMQIRDIDDRLRENGERYADNMAVIGEDLRLNWADLNTRINQCATALIAAGIKPGDRVAILARNSARYMVLMFGIGRAGGCIVPLSTLASPDSLTQMVHNSDAKLLFVSAAYAHMLTPKADDLTNLVNPILYLDTAPDGHQNLDDFIEGFEANDPCLVLDQDTGFNLIYSSGTTGTPKGIMQNRSYRSRESSTLITAFGLGPEAKTLVSTPLYSNTTLFLVLSVMAGGGCAVVMEKFDAKRYLELSQEHGITHVILVPVQYSRLLKYEKFDDYDLSSFKGKYSTSAPLHMDTKREILDRWSAGGLIEFYGMTEGGVTTGLVCHEHPDKLDTVGRPSVGSVLLAIDEQGNELPTGEIGELVGRSANMMKGYHKRQDDTDKASWYDADGLRYQRSGDIGWIDEDRFVHLLDRKKDMIISGGFNVYAIDLEKSLLEDDRIDDAAVIGVESEAWGETPLGYVVLKKSGADLDDIRTACNDRLGKAQRIAKLIEIDTLPRSPIGKVLKRELKQRPDAKV